MWTLLAIAESCSVDVPGGIYACENNADCPDGQVCRDQLCEQGDAVYNAATGCDDGVKNGDELGTDCGGACPACAEGEPCARAADCASAICQNNVCMPSSCTDEVQNGDESDKDCGGSCEPCGVGATCTQNADCASNLCGAGQCSTAACSDGARNGEETDKDCGGPDCPKCEAGLACNTADDCASALCTDGGTCTKASCTDRVKNGTEANVDCGGTCDKCADGATCDKGDDCSSGVCANGACAAPSCTDGLKNGAELDKDCGGDNYCPRCIDGQACETGTDCVSEYCDAASHLCKTPTCEDGVRNQDEENVDCGGDTCACCVNTAIKNEPADVDRSKGTLGVANKRNYATTQVVVPSKASTMQRFGMYFVRGVTNAEKAARPATLALQLRDDAGKVLKTASAAVAQDFTSGYVYWEKLNFSLKAGTRYYFTVYLAGAQTEGLSTEYATDAVRGYTPAEAYTKYLASTAADSDFAEWSGWTLDIKADRVFLIQSCVQ